MEYSPRTALSGVGPCVDAGGAVLFDYRTVHRGTANRSAEDRPLLYLTFARPWFSDTVNFPTTSVWVD